MNARFAGKCQCGATFKKGAEIDYNRQVRRVVRCPACSASTSREGGDAFDMAWEDRCAEQCGLFNEQQY